MVRVVEPDEPVTAAVAAAIDAVVEAAFSPLVARGEAGGEAALVRRLRRDHDVLLELVAVDDTDGAANAGVVGHVLFSRLRAEGPVVFAALAPLSVSPSAQRRGVGAGLVLEGLRRLVPMGVDVVLVLGDPAYYARFGFNVDEAALRATTPYDGAHLMGIALRRLPLPARPAVVTYPDAFSS